MGQVAVLNFMVRVGLLEKVSFEQVCMQRFEGGRKLATRASRQNN